MSKTPIQLAVQMALYDERNAIVEWLTSKRDSFRAAAHSKRELGVAPEWEKVEIMRTMLAIQEQPASESAVWVEPPYEKGEL